MLLTHLNPKLNSDGKHEKHGSSGLSMNMPITRLLESTSARTYSSLPLTQLPISPEWLTDSSEIRQPPPGSSESEICDPYTLSMFLKMYKSPPRPREGFQSCTVSVTVPTGLDFTPSSSEPSHYEAVDNVCVSRGKLEGWREIKAIKGRVTGPISH